MSGERDLDKAEGDQGQAAAGIDPAAFDTGVPHIARVYDYWLGGKDNFAADRELAEQFMAADPSVRPGSAATARSSAGPCTTWRPRRGIRQFLDIGTGIPTANNTHEVAQRAAPAARVVYVDNDPIVLAARPGAAGQPPGGRDRLHRRRPARHRHDPGRGGADPGLQPAGRAMLIGVLHCIPDEDYPGGSWPR